MGSVLRIEENKMITLKQRLKARTKSEQGFTLVELIVVLVILAILAAFTIPAMLGFVEDAKGKAAIAEAREVYVAAQAIATETKGNPDEIEEKLPEIVKGDMNLIYDPDNLKKDVHALNGSKPVIHDNIKGTFGHVGVELGASNTDEKAMVKSIQYIDKTGSYLVTITPGGSAEVTKIEKD